MEKLASKVLEESTLKLDLSDSLLHKLDLFLSNTNLDEEQRKTFIQLIEETHGEGFTNALIS